MAYMNYKEGTGVRARSDLSANAGVGDESADGRLTTKELAEIANLITGMARQAERRRQPTVSIPLRTLRRIADAVIEVVNREDRP